MGPSAKLVSMLKSMLSYESYQKIRNIYFSVMRPYYKNRFKQLSNYQSFQCYLLPQQLPEQAKGAPFFSQRGQDWFLSTVVFPGKKQGFFVDIGANHPVNLSNTLFFEKIGWTGIAFEPQENLCNLWKAERETPCYQIALGESSGVIVLNQVVSDTWEHALSYVDGADSAAIAKIPSNVCVKQVEVPLKRLDEVLIEKGINEVDFISIDVEGFEMEVLRGIDFNKITIRCFVIENDATCIGDSEIWEFLRGHGYTHVARLLGDDVFLKLD